MSEEKLYVVKNAKGLYLSMSDDTRLRWREGQVVVTNSQRIAHDLCTEHGGHVVTLVEEPKKVVLTKEQAKVVKYAHSGKSPASNIAFSGNNDEELLMNAYVNGYTVVKEKKYRVLAPHSWWYADDAPTYLLFSPDCGMCLTEAKENTSTVFTKEQLSAFGLDGAPFTKEEVTDDGIR